MSTLRCARSHPLAAGASTRAPRARRGAPSPIICKTSPRTPEDCHEAENLDVTSALDRRSMMLGAALSAALQVSPALAAEGEVYTYADPSDAFQVTVPSGWSSSVGEIEGNTSFQGASGSRRTVVFYPSLDTARDTNVSIVISTVGADYTSLGSFGSVDEFAENLVGSMDRSFLKRFSRNKDPVQTAELVTSKKAGNQYQVEYTVTKPNEEMKHLYSTVALGYNGMYNRFYTLTAQCREADVKSTEKTLKAIVNSFKPPKL